jgi:hypothetical protein
VVVSPGWTAVVGVSLALIAFVQLAVLIGLFVAWRRAQAQMQQLQQQVQSVIDEVRPELMKVIDEARTASSMMQALAGDVRGRLDAVDDATRNVRDRVTRVADTVHWAAANLPIPVKVSGPAAMAAWAGVRVARNLIDRARRRSARQAQPVPADYPPL